jgi:hypothetical protein
MRGWTKALPLVAISVALCGGAVARGVATAPAESTDTAPRAKPEEHKNHHHRFTHARRAFAQQQQVKPAPRAPDEKAPAAGPRPLPPQPPVPQEEASLQSPVMPSLQPRTVPTVRISGATPEAPESVEAPVTTATVDTGAARRLDPNTALTNLLAAADTIEDAAPAAQSDPPSTSTAMKLLAVFGVCASVAGGCLGLVALNARRRKRGAVLLPSRRTSSRPLPARDDHLAQRVAQQRLFPHQFGAAIRSERA